MAHRRRPSKKKSPAGALGGGSLALLAGAIAIGAIALWPKKASAATPPGGSSTAASKITVVSSGTDLNAGTLAAGMPQLAFVVDKGLPQNGAAVFLDAVKPDGSLVFGPAGAEPSITTITKAPYLAHKADITALIADGTFAGYLDPTQPYYKKIVDAGGKVLIWSANPDGTVIRWWLTQWS